MRLVVTTDKAPKAIGPYSQAIRCGDMLYVSGQIALDPETGEVTGKSVGDQTRRVLTSAGEILAAGGASFASVVKTTVYLTDMTDFAAMNDVYATFFSGEPPARATVAVAGLPRGVLVEIDFVAQVVAGSQSTPAPRGAGSDRTED